MVVALLIQRILPDILAHVSYFLCLLDLSSNNMYEFSYVSFLVAVFGWHSMNDITLRTQHPYVIPYDPGCNLLTVMSALSFARQAFGREKPHVRGFPVQRPALIIAIGGFSPQSPTG